MDFYETKMGRIFFDSQVPKLIHALQDIASALSKPAPALKMDDAAEPNYLHDLLYRMYEAEVFGNRKQLARFDADVTQAEIALLPDLGQSRELFEQYQTAVSRRTDAEIERAFCSGYRAGANAFLNGIYTLQPPQTGGEKNGQ